MIFLMDNPFFLRFLLYVPETCSPGVYLRTAHPPPSMVVEELYLRERLTTELVPKMDYLYGLQVNSKVQFPETRLIQYDCGKYSEIDIMIW